MDNLIAISDVRAKLPKIIASVDKNLSRVFVSVNNKPKAVIMSIDELESLEETAEILSIPGAKKFILEGWKEAKQGKGIPLSDLI